MEYIARVQPLRGSERTMLPELNTRIENLEQAIGQLSPAESRSDDQFDRIQQEVRALMPVREAEPPRPAWPPTLRRPGEP